MATSPTTKGTTATATATVTAPVVAEKEVARPPVKPATTAPLFTKRAGFSQPIKSEGDKK